MQSAWARRTRETFAIVTIGDGAIEVIAPREHPLLREAGPESAHKIARFFENPNLMRLLGAAQIAFGAWLVIRQCRSG